MYSENRGLIFCGDNFRFVVYILKNEEASTFSYRRTVHLPGLFAHRPCLPLH
jgi:hypothetical protein